ncbi:MAG TPA: glycoside hydrolase family 15 protein [Candidatus Dormibacteraeota bacterium]|nr:glycoside hydrolase family 15 protein [Candidatus Dormibacteraeota bacterium]
MGEPVGRWQAPPIRDYGMIGDTRTAGLTSRFGSIDWMCWPRFDSEPVFGRLVDRERGGCFEIAVEGVTHTERRYRDRSTVLETTWESGTGRATLVEAMAMGTDSPTVVRRLSCDAGSVSVRVLHDPRPGLPGTHDEAPIAVSVSPPVSLRPGVPLHLLLRQGESLSTVLTDEDHPVHADRATPLIDATDRWWRRWSRDIRSGEHYGDVLVRSLMNLRMLTYTPTGAPVAAPTTSLPEEIGGVRNWDYRFSWPRDASVGVAAFLAAGKKSEACAFVDWLVKCACREEAPIRVLYDLYGERSMPEREVDGVSGYHGSLPVRVGNLAEEQHQLDVYGWVIDALWNLTQADEKLSREGRRTLAEYADFVVDNWQRPDAGLWEVRAEPAHSVHSKVWAWIALDRAARTAAALGMSRRRAARWERERDLLAEDVRRHGFSAERGCYVRAYGSDELDSALLLLPLTGFDMDGGRERVAETIDSIWKELGAGGPLLYRYRVGHDGLPGREGAFLPCSFWLLEGLLRLGRREEGLRLFEEVLGIANELLLLPEEIDPSTGAYLGNYPLALSQAGLVHAVTEVQRVLGG